MRLFIVLFRKEIKELLTRQLIISIAAMLFIFAVIGKSVGSHSRSSGGRNSVVLLDLDRSPLSARVAAAMRGAKAEVLASGAAEIGAALEDPRYSGENSFVLIPAGLEKEVSGGTASRIEYYSRFRRDASGLGPALAAGRIKKLSSAVSGAVSSWLLERRLPGLPADLVRNPAPAKEFAVIDGRMEQVPVAQVVAFMQSQSYFFPMAVFFIVMLSAQMIMTAVASEKENKTLETLLSSPVDRRLLVLSKLTASTAIAAALSLAYMLGMRSFMSGINSIAGAGPAAASADALARLGLIMTPAGYLLTGLSVLFCILCAISIAFILGILAEDVKSVQTLLRKRNEITEAFGGSDLRRMRGATNEHTGGL
ncbi:MAG: hypothetical protein COT18_10445, partial [Elusimicrobia bacterium CG08_land_8_20_14_0_20_59_10]